MKTLHQKKEDCLLLLAYASLKQWNEPTNPENLSAEKSRLERVVTDIFTKTNIDIDYNQFILEFIKEHSKEIIYGNSYTYDVDIPDEYTELNVNTIIEKYHRKSNGSKY